MGLAVSWYTSWFSSLCQRSFPFRCFPLAGSAPFLAPVRRSTPAVEPCYWVGVSGYTTWFSTLCQHSFPFCCLPLAGAATFLAPVCWSTPMVVPCCWVGGVFAASLGFLPCAVLFLRGLQLAQLSQLQVPLGIFRSPGVCTSASLVT